MEETRLDFLAVGEALIDMTPKDGAFLPKVGGAPANSACVAAKLGLRSAAAARVGDDVFGRQIRRTLKDCGLIDSYIQTDPERGTTLAFVHLDDKGDRSFSFYRKGLADTALAMNVELLCAAENARVLHFGSVALAEEPERRTVLTLAMHAKGSGVTVSFDPNLRFPLWKGREDELRREVLGAMDYASILKVSEEEAEWLFGISDAEKAAGTLRERYGLDAVFVTCGGKGAVGAFKCGTVKVPAPDVTVVDTTGAGDCFGGAAMTKLLELGGNANALTLDEAEELMRFAAAAGSLATTKHGAIDAIPSREEIERLL